MSYEQLRQKHLAEVKEALQENTMERARLLALERIYEQGDAALGNPFLGPFDSAAEIPKNGESHAVEGAASRTKAERKRDAILAALDEVGQNGLHDRLIAAKVRDAGIDLPTDPNRPSRTGLDFELYGMAKEGLIERCAPATWRKVTKAQAAT